MGFFRRALIAARSRLRQEDPSGGFRSIVIPQRQAGMAVDHDTALRLAAVWACVRVISETVAQLPWRVYVDRGEGGRERMGAHPVEALLSRRPNPEMGAFTFRETLLAWALTWGNGYAEIVRDRAGRASELWPIAPDRVDVKRTADGVLFYEVANPSGPNTALAASDVFHLHGLGYDGRCGYSVISLAARSIGLGLAADQFGASFFGNGTVIGGILKHPGQLSEKGLAHLRESWSQRHQGPTNAMKPLILEEGLDYEQLGIPPEDAQFLETRRFQVQDVCRWFRVPPHKVADLERATFSNIEHQSIEFVTDTVVPWVQRLEQEASRKLFGASAATGVYTKLNTNALLRGDAQSRADFYTKLWQLGVLSVNEIRELEELNPIEDGDKRFVQLNMTTLERAGEEPPEPEPTPSEPDPQEDADEEMLTAAVAKIDRKIFSAFSRHLRLCEDEADYHNRCNRTLLPKAEAYAKALDAPAALILARLRLPSDDPAAQAIIQQWIRNHLERWRAFSAEHVGAEALPEYQADTRQLARLLRGAA